MDADKDTRSSVEIIASYLEKDARLVARLSHGDEHLIALRMATALRDPERVARFLEGVDVEAARVPRQHPVSRGTAA